MSVRTNGTRATFPAQLNGQFTKVMDLSVRAPLGSRIEIRCVGARRGACPFTKKLIPRTTRRVTTLTRYFKRKRILAAGTVITVRVTRSGRIGTYERLVTRRGRKLPRVTVRCIDSVGRTVQCS